MKLIVCERVRSDEILIFMVITAFDYQLYRVSSDCQVIYELLNYLGTNQPFEVFFKVQTLTFSF